MNSNNVISLPAVADLLPFRAVKATALGIDYAGAADKVIGFTLPGDLNRNHPTVQLHGSFIEAVLGDGTDIAAGDELEQFAGGTYIKKGAGTAVGVALAVATIVGDRFNAVIHR
jgi:hypothetical protein